MTEHIHIKLNLGSDSFVIMWNLSFKFALNKPALSHASMSIDDMWCVDRRLILNVDSGWFNEQLRVSFVFMSKMIYNHHIAPKHT